MTTSNRPGSKPRMIRPVLPPAILGAIILLATALLAGTDWFELVQYAVSILALIAAVIAVQHRRWWWALPLLPLAVLWNPVLPIDLPASVWIPAHYLGGGLFVLVGALVRVPDEGGAAPARPKR